MKILDKLNIFKRLSNLEKESERLYSNIEDLMGVLSALAEFIEKDTDARIALNDKIEATINIIDLDKRIISMDVA